VKIIAFEHDGACRLGVLRGEDAVVDLDQAQPGLPRDLPTLLHQGEAGMRRVAEAAGRASASITLPLAGLRLLPPVPAPGKIVCLGLNYADHAAEGGHARPDYPALFLRCASSLVAHGDPIVRPRCSSRLDYEAELAVVIGRGGRHIRTEDALGHVAGYACFNDGSVRDYQTRTAQWTIGKNFDGTGAFGPAFVTADELPPGARGLRIRCRLNGQVMQDASTSDMLFPVAETIALLSECMTLETGDVIVTGTPSGVGHVRKPPVWMKDGDVVEVEIEGVGVLRNPVRDEAAPA